VFHSVIDMSHFDGVANKAEEKSERMKGIAACSDQRGVYGDGIKMSSLNVTLEGGSDELARA